MTQFPLEKFSARFLAFLIGMLVLACVAPELGAQDESKRADASSSKSESPVEDPPATPPPWILRPYQVRVCVTVESHPLLGPVRSPRFLEQVDSQLRAEIHQMWEVSVQQAEESSWLTAGQLAEMSQEQVPENFKADEIDKVFFTSISYGMAGYGISTREWDQNSQTLGSLHASQTPNLNDLPACVAGNLLEAFRPLAELEIVDEETTEFLVRGGEYLPRDPAMAQFRPGDYLTVYMRYLDRQRVVQRIQPVPWTFLKVESLHRSRIAVSVVSAFQSPIAGARRRVEIMAMRIRPHLEKTDVLIYPRGDRQNPLVGFRCEVMDRIPTEDDPVEDRLKLETDRQGIVTIPAGDDSILRHLYVYSGQALLAKVPLIPGNEPFLEIETPDDRHRLFVEGEVSLMQSQLIDIVATREVLMARARGASIKKNWDEVSKFILRLQELPTLQDFEARINALQVQAVYEARQDRDRVAESRIRRLCSGIRESAEKHLNPFRIAEFRREMNEERNHAQK